MLATIKHINRYGSDYEFITENEYQELFETLFKEELDNFDATENGTVSIEENEDLLHYKLDFLHNAGICDEDIINTILEKLDGNFINIYHDSYYRDDYFEIIELEG